jgi:hypothetical protein
MTPSLAITILVAFSAWFFFALASSEIAANFNWTSFRMLGRLYRPPVRSGGRRYLDVVVPLVFAGVGQALMVIAVVDPASSLSDPGAVWVPAVELAAAAAWLGWLATRARQESRRRPRDHRTL